MLGFVLPGGALRVLCLGAHPDDVELGCGATLLGLAARPSTEITTLVLTGSAQRQAEARQAAERFCAGARLTVRFAQLTDGRLPTQWAQVKDTLEELAQDVRPDLIFAPRIDDAHQDHRTIAQIVPTVWRDALVLGYEVPQWEGTLGTATTYVVASPDVARRKVELLNECYPSQAGRDWWDGETFLGLLRLRGVECRAQYAEAFAVTKAVLDPARLPAGGPS